MGTRESLSDYSVLRRAVRGLLRHWWWRVGVWWVLVWAVLRLPLSLMRTYQWVGNYSTAKPFVFYSLRMLMYLAFCVDLILAIIALWLAWIVYKRINDLARDAGLDISSLDRGKLFTLCCAPGLRLFLLLFTIAVTQFVIERIWVLDAGAFITSSPTMLFEWMGKYAFRTMALALAVIFAIALLLYTGKKRYGIALLLSLYLYYLALLLLSLLNILLTSSFTPLLAYSATPGAKYVGLVVLIVLLIAGARNWRRVFLLNYVVLIAGLVCSYLLKLEMRRGAESFNNWLSHLARYMAEMASVIQGPLVQCMSYAEDSGETIHYLTCRLLSWYPRFHQDWHAFLVAFWLNVAWVALWWLLIRYVIFGWLARLKQRG